MMTQNAMSRLRSFPSVATKKHRYRYGYDPIFFCPQTKNLFAWEYYKMMCFVKILASISALRDKTYHAAREMNKCKNEISVLRKDIDALDAKVKDCEQKAKGKRQKQRRQVVCSA